MLTKVFIEKRRGANQQSPVVESVLRVYKNVGDLVEVGDLLFITTDDEKVNEYASNMRGVIRKVYCQIGDQITPDMPVLEILGTCDGTCPSKKAQDSAETAVSKPRFAVDQPAIDEKSVQKPLDKIKATSYAKMLANKLGLSLDEVNGTGPGGWITRSDVLLHAIKSRLIDENFDDSNLFADEDLKEPVVPVKPAKPVLVKNGPTEIKSECVKCQPPTLEKEENELIDDEVTPSEFFQECIRQTVPFSPNVATSANEVMEKSTNSPVTDQSSNAKDDSIKCNVVKCDVFPTKEESTKQEISSKCNTFKCDVTAHDDELKPAQAVEHEQLVTEQNEIKQDRSSLAVVRAQEQELLFMVSSRVDVTNVVETYQEANSCANFPLSVVMLSYSLKALANVLKSYPLFNSAVQSDGQIISNQNITIGLVTGATGYNKAPALLLDRVNEMGIEDIAQELQKLRVDKNYCENCSVKHPTFIMHDLMQFGSKNAVSLAPNHLATFSIEDLYKIALRNGQSVVRLFYFVPFTCFVDPQFIDKNVACEFVNAFKETVEQLMLRTAFGN